jgi:hypothetical protein
MKALILNNIVVDLNESEFPVSSEMSWVDCDDTVKVGYTYADGTFTAPETVEIPYSIARQNEYPDIGDQLDMQYHDLVNGTTTWKDAIAQVKADNPKPE